ncbi:MAG TPA: S8 family peptidase [Thermoanaerobaculia bacterium]|nr:S8 family peptidase [Thermoanaerobaculia bacterium]
MATRKTAKREPVYLERRLIEQLMFGSGRVRRFTQDSPVLPDVWLEYAYEPDKRSRQLTDAKHEPEDFPPVSLLLSPYKENSTGEVRRVLRERLHDQGHKRRVVYNQSVVSAKLYFEDLVRTVIPMTDWWTRLTKRFDVAHLQKKDVQIKLAEAVKDPEHPKPLPARDGKEQRIPPDVLWMIRVAGAIALVHDGKPLPPVFVEQGAGAATTEDWLPLVQAVAELVKDVEAAPPEARIYSISLNREATATVSRSTLAIKADAARQLFNISCKELRWAVIDSGVDARHLAFRRRTKEGAEADPLKTRVYETYDFTLIDELLDPDQKDELPARLKKSKRKPELQKQLTELRAALGTGRSIDWRVIAPLLRVPHTEGEYTPPGNDHGTHVAGILAGNWLARESEGVIDEDLIGVCPDLELYDLRVLDANGRGDEFTVMAALQFVRWLNSTNDYVAVHGANVSISIPHDVANYACGRTPVCDECERVTASGVVVVVAAGNKGYDADSYQQISITDPGNAELVITVGATHRFRPHTYGVSYFSSRGPTGDGRIKPDLVAPGEKITAPLPDNQYGLKDGTSMAAPHVSGAAALLMARHNELVGRPARIKQILCDTATNLGRERYFQGAGMLDVLRALQSV